MHPCCNNDKEFLSHTVGILLVRWQLTLSDYMEQFWWPICLVVVYSGTPFTWAIDREAAFRASCSVTWSENIGCHDSQIGWGDHSLAKHMYLVIFQKYPRARS